MDPLVGAVLVCLLMAVIFAGFLVTFKADWQRRCRFYRQAERLRDLVEAGAVDQIQDLLRKQPPTK